MNIAVLGSTYPRTPEDPGVPWQRETVKRCAQAGHSVTVLAPSWRDLKSHDIDGIPVLRWRYAPAFLETLTHDEGAPNKQGNFFFKALSLSYLFFGILAVLKWSFRHRYDVIHCHWPFPHGLMTLLPQKLLGTRIVMTCHGAELALGRKSKCIRKVLAWILETGDALCANSSHTAQEMQQLVPRAVQVIPYGATVTAAQAGESPPTPVTPPLLLNCGRLIQRKGLHFLLRALPLVLKEQPVKLVITGEGDRKAEWMELTTSLGLEEVVEWAGFVSKERLAELYHTCSCYVHPAIYDDQGDTEGLGVVLIEALRHRKPVVASAVGGILDVIKHEQTGLLVPEKDVEALANAILRVLTERELSTRLADQGFSYCQEVFSWERIISLTLQIYQGQAPVVNSPQPPILPELPASCSAPSASDDA